MVSDSGALNGKDLDGFNSEWFKYPEVFQYCQFKNNLDTQTSQIKRGKDLFPLNDTDPNRIRSSAFNGKAEEE